MGCCSSSPRNNDLEWVESAEVDNPISDSASDSAEAEEQARKDAEKAKQEAERAKQEAERAKRFQAAEQLLKNDAEEQTTKLADEKAKRELATTLAISVAASSAVAAAATIAHTMEDVAYVVQALATTSAISCAASSAAAAAATVAYTMEDVAYVVQEVEKAEREAVEHATKEASDQIFTLPAQSDRLATPKVTIGHLSHFTSWLNAQGIWEENITKENCNAELQSGLLLCALMKHLVPETNYVSLNKKPRYERY
jgi:hypothetical protein